jgi:hypothetical protein
MGDVLQFTPRPKRTAPEALPPLAGADLRASLEEAAQTALDTADRIIAVLDRFDGDASHEGSANPALSLAATETVETASTQEAAAEAEPSPTLIRVPPMRWGGRGNIIAAAGTVLLELVGGDRR